MGTAKVSSSASRGGRPPTFIPVVVGSLAILVLSPIFAGPLSGFVESRGPQATGSVRSIGVPLGPGVTDAPVAAAVGSLSWTLPPARASGISWTQLHSKSAPSPRFGAAMAYDGRDGYVVLFGGALNLAGSRGVNDTWKFANGSWTNLSLTHAPGPRTDASITYDPVDRSLVLFGGYDPLTFAALRDTWEFSAGKWTLVGTSGPSTRSNAMMAYDAKDHYVLMFGGVNPNLFVVLNDTWKFVHGSWSKVNTSVAPPGRMGGVMAYDAAIGHVLLFGGDSSVKFLDDTWRYLNGTWARLHPAVHPSARALGSGAYLPPGRCFIVFGGTNSGANIANFVDTWKYSNATWTNLTAGGSPPARSDASASYDPVTGSMLLVGGENRTQTFNDTWSLA